MRNIQASTPLFTDVHGPRPHEGTFKNDDLFESLTEKCVYVLYKTCAGVNLGPMGQTFKKTHSAIMQSFQALYFLCYLSIYNKIFKPVHILIHVD